ncbi:hypothetical protein LEP1GSC050_3573 [Leptospira broomii serovar Hurstbridge str. 5399]|uniref:Uncharacterized protein n=1 Tax=Leptospira broomii serovar Hurstbridge str. 5399 TaxID=1049789 RepID=T0FCL7_9LEPT|nr:hypothetical protein LEP1GSC050_3573 [Leptospira broomii serovar Hurstbridge str. 5399]
MRHIWGQDIWDLLYDSSLRLNLMQNLEKAMELFREKSGVAQNRNRPFS